MTHRTSPRRKPNRSDIYAKYREILEMPDLTRKEVDKMRESIRLIAQSICEHVWGKKFY